MLAACSEAAPDPSEEIAGELRALRLLLQQRPAAVAPAADAAALQAAMAPLREALDGVVEAQRDQGGRQVALAQELQRWSQLLVESVGASRADEAKALAARLQQLEQALQQQEQRHREVEAMLQGALDRTADRLEDFLRRVGGMDPAATPPAAPGALPEPAPAGNPGTPPPGDAAAPAGGRQAGRGPQRGGVRWAWLGMAGLALGLGWFGMRRLRRQPPRSPALESPLPAPGSDPSADEIWAAAALLGEAVGRLRQRTFEESSPGAAAEAAGSAGLAADDDVFVLDDGDPGGAASPVASSEQVAPVDAPADGPPVVVCRLRVQDPARARQAVLALLAADPRVLRRPLPAAVLDGDRLDVSFALLPGLPAGERSHVEQQLRDAVA